MVCFLSSVNLAEHTDFSSGPFAKRCDVSALSLESYIHILVFVYLTGSISVGLRVLQHIIFDDSSFYLMKHQVLIDMVPTKHTSKIGSDDSTYRGGNGGNRLPLYLLHLE